MATQTQFAELSFEEIEEIMARQFHKTQNMPQNMGLNFLKAGDFQIYFI